MRLSHTGWGTILAARQRDGVSGECPMSDRALTPRRPTPVNDPTVPRSLHRDCRPTRAMTVNDKRPVNLALGTIHFPLPAIASILHRISGFALFGLLPAVLWAWQQSLASPEAFQALVDSTLFRLAAIVVLAGVLYHFVAGLKHLVMDLGIGETLEGGRRLAVATLVISAALIAAMAVWVW